MAAFLARRTRRVIVAFATVVLFIVLAGVTYQSVANAVERRRFPHPGKLVDVGEHQLHLYCVGDRAPLVVLEAPAGTMSMNWAWVQNDLRSTTRVCSYDRSGLGWSEAGDEDYDPSRVADELHALLQQAGERGPIILGGQELGAALAQLYAVRYPREVIALVLVDDPALSPAASSSVRSAKAWPWLARVGILRSTRSLSKLAGGLPAPAAGAAQAFFNRPDHLTRAASEISSVRDVASQAAALTVDPTIVVTRVTTGKTRVPVVLASHDEARTVTRALLDAVERARRQ